MKRIEFPKIKDYNGESVRYIQEKHDGHLVRINNHDGELVALTKNNKDITEKITKIPGLMVELSILPANTVVFAELHCPGIRATSVPTMLNDADGRLQLSIFAAPLFEGVRWDHKDLCGVMNAISKKGIRITKTWVVTDKGIDTNELLEEARRKNLEGWVLKQSHMGGWYKLKPVKTVDVFVLSVCKSFEPTYYGGLKSIHVGVYKGSKVIDLGYVGTGFDQNFRETVDQKKLIGEVAEIRFDSVAANGKLRFPRFIRWRKDKDKTQCTIDQIEREFERDF